MITPAQISESLNVPPSTIRRWASIFEHHLSPRKGKKRKYTSSDLDVFRRIKEFSNSGYSLDKIDGMLAVVEKPKDKTTALLSLADFTQSLELAHNQIAQLSQALLDQQNKLIDKLEEQSARIETLEEWIQSPWYKRIGKKPPIK